MECKLRSSIRRAGISLGELGSLHLFSTSRVMEFLDFPRSWLAGVDLGVEGTFHFPAVFLAMRYLNPGYSIYLLIHVTCMYIISLNLVLTGESIRIRG